MTRIIQYTAGIAALLLSCQSYADSAVTDSFDWQGHQLVLQQAQGKCELEIASPGKEKATHVLNMTPPCYFLRRGEAQPLHYAFPKQNVSAAFIILGTPLTPDEQKTWNVSASMQCGTQGQGVFFTGKTFRLSEKSLNRMLLCKDKGTDEKNFRFLLQ
ncbi:hypothetical protein ACUY4R_000158 [Kosakonia sp. BK9b]|uniref:hypothetical protein n=1 Tax=Kosakonia sp. TaxID=1916651 RepID=UPI002898E239|nr:hypothetical protein [Kosakonia sp.]